MAIQSVKLSNAEAGRRLEIPKLIGVPKWGGWPVGRDLLQIFGGEIIPVGSDRNMQVYRSPQEDVWATQREGRSWIMLAGDIEHNLLALRAYEQVLAGRRPEVRNARNLTAIFRIESDSRPRLPMSRALASRAEVRLRHEIPQVVSRLTVTSQETFLNALNIGAQALADVFSAPQSETEHWVAQAVGVPTWEGLSDIWEGATRAPTPVNAARHVLEQVGRAAQQ